MSKQQLHWYARDMDAYSRDTAHLSLAEHGAYTLLLDQYYRTKRPLPANEQQLLRICRAFADSDAVAVRSVLREFFWLDVCESGEYPDQYRHNRVDAELQKAFAISDKRAEAGRQGAQQTNGKRGGKQAANADTPTPTPTEEQTPLASNEKVSFDADGFMVPEAQLRLWTKAYPAVDVSAELLKATAWLIANPKNRKSNYGKFLTNWLSRAQDRAPAAGGGPTKQTRDYV